MKSIRDKEISVEFFIPLLMLLFIYALTILSFKMESKRTKEYLKKSFQAEIIKE